MPVFVLQRVSEMIANAPEQIEQSLSHAAVKRTKNEIQFQFSSAFASQLYI